MIKTKTILSLALLGAMPVEAPTSPDVGVQMSQRIDWSRGIDFQSVGAHKIKMPEKLVKMFQEKADKMVMDNFQGCSNPPSFKLNFLDTVFSFVFNVASLFNKDMPLLVQTVLISIRSKILYDLHNEAQDAEIERAAGNVVMPNSGYDHFEITLDNNTGRYTARSSFNNHTFPITSKDIEMYIQDNDCTRLVIRKYDTNPGRLRSVHFDQYISAECKQNQNNRPFWIIRLYRSNDLTWYSFFKNIEFKYPTENVPPTFKEPIKKIIDMLNEYSKGNFADSLDSSFAIKNFSGYQLTRWLDQSLWGLGCTLLQFTHTSNKSILEFMIPMCDNPHIVISIEESIGVQEELTQALNDRGIKLADIKFIRKINEKMIEICIYKKDENDDIPYSTYTLFMDCKEDLISKDPEANNREYIKIGDKCFEVVMIDNSYFAVPASHSDSDYFLSQNHRINTLIKARVFDLQTIEKNIEDLNKGLEGAQSEEEKAELKKELDKKIKEGNKLSLERLTWLRGVDRRLKDVALAVKGSLKEADNLFGVLFPSLKDRLDEAKLMELNQKLKTKITAAMAEESKPKCEELIKHTLKLVQAPLSEPNIVLARVGLVLAELLKMKIAAIEQIGAEVEGILKEAALVITENDKRTIAHCEKEEKIRQSKAVSDLASYINEMIEREVDQGAKQELNEILAKVETLAREAEKAAEEVEEVARRRRWAKSLFCCCLSKSSSDYSS